MTVLGFHRETTIEAPTYREVVDQTTAELERFFGPNHGHDVVMEIEPKDIVISRDGQGNVVRFYTTYTARVRISYTNYEAQQ